MITRLLATTATMAGLLLLRGADHIPLKRSSQTENGPGGVNTSLPGAPYLPTTERWWTRMFDAGIKFVRIGQYEDTSDVTGWDWVEHEKGKFGLRPEIDTYVDSLVDNGTIVELQLLYGNPFILHQLEFFPVPSRPLRPPFTIAILGSTLSFGRLRRRSKSRPSCATRSGW